MQISRDLGYEFHLAKYVFFQIDPGCDFDQAQTVRDEFEYSMNCHCSNCRRTTGAAFKPIGGIPIDKLHTVSGSDALMRIGEASAHDVHCRLCGSILYSVVRDGRFAHVALGTLLGEPGIRPTHHIFVGSKAPWFTITDGLPQYEEFST